MPRIAAGDMQINYESYGQGEPLLLIMGFGLPGIAWLPALPFLSGFRCIYFDNRGTGNSDKPEKPYTIAEMADDASNLLTTLGIARTKVYGISMGGMIAQELILRHPGQVERAVLGCTMAGGGRSLPADERSFCDDAGKPGAGIGYNDAAVVSARIHRPTSGTKAIDAGGIQDDATNAARIDQPDDGGDRRV
jgi:pimeloyl-ACP methyl ester carboxylesterase